MLSWRFYSPPSFPRPSSQFISKIVTRSLPTQSPLIPLRIEIIFSEFIQSVVFLLDRKCNRGAILKRENWKTRESFFSGWQERGRTAFGSRSCRANGWVVHSGNFASETTSTVSTTSAASAASAATAICLKDSLCARHNPRRLLAVVSEISEKIEFFSALNFAQESTSVDSSHNANF